MPTNRVSVRKVLGYTMLFIVTLASYVGYIVAAFLTFSPQ